MKGRILLLACIFAIPVFFSTGCRNPEKLANQGRYDEAIEVAAKRLRKNRNKTEIVAALERAFNKANERDVRSTEALRKQTNDPDRWQKINNIHQVIKYRQGKVEPLLPLYIGSRKAEFKFVRIEDLENESRTNAAEELYAAADKLLQRAEDNKDRMAAREAYDKLIRTREYFKSYKETDNWLVKAERLGTTHVAFRVVNNANVIMPAGFERELQKMNVSDLNRNWVHYDLNPNTTDRYDFKIALNLTGMAISPESEKSREYREEKEIQDGWIYTYDLNGNIAKDSLGREIKRPKMVKVSADVVELLQTKYCHVQGALEYYDAGNRRLKSLPIATDGAFENYASTFRGDKRALSDETLRKIGNRPQPFPASEAMIMLSVDKLKQIVVNEMVNNQSLVN